MNLSEEKLTYIANKVKGKSCVVLDNCNIASLSLKPESPFTNIVFLSLRNNLIKDISFLVNMRNLYYLDLFNNNIDDFEPLNIKNVFGFLGISIEHYNEKKIFTIHGLNAVIVRIQIDDQTYLKSFLKNNPSVLLLNSEVNYGLRKFTKIERRANHTVTQRLEIPINDLSLAANEELAELENFFNLTVKPTRDKLIMIAKVYNVVYKYKSQQKVFYLVHQKEKSEFRKILFDATALVKDDEKCNLIILSSVLLYILGIISKNLSIYIINYIIKNYYFLKESIPYDLMDEVHFLPVYYEIYDAYQRKHHHKEYHFISDALKMDKLVYQSNLLYDNMHKAKPKGYFDNKKTMIKDKAEFVCKLQINNEIIAITQFLSDFIYYEKMDNDLFRSKLNDDFLVLIEFRDVMFKNSKICSSDSLSERKYQNNQIEGLGAFFYFKRNEGRIENMPKSNFLINLIESKKRKKKTFYNYDDDYKKKDDISVKECFKISSYSKKPELTKGKSEVSEKKKVKSFIYTNQFNSNISGINFPNITTYAEGENSSVAYHSNNNSSIKLKRNRVIASVDFEASGRRGNFKYFSTIIPKKGVGLKVPQPKIINLHKRISTNARVVGDPLGSLLTIRELNEKTLRERLYGERRTNKSESNNYKIRRISNL